MANFMFGSAYDKDVITVISRPCRSRSWVPDRKQTHNHGQSPLDGTEVFIIFCNFCVPSWNSASFSKFSRTFPSPTLYKVETHKKEFWIQESNVVCGVRGEVGLVWIGKRPRIENCPKSFNHHDCSYDLPDIKRALSPLRYGEVHKEQGNTWDSLLLCGRSVCCTCVYVSGMSLAQILSKRKQSFLFSCIRVIMIIITSFSWYNFVWRFLLLLVVLETPKTEKQQH